jgi:hypothetical protein
MHSVLDMLAMFLANTFHNVPVYVYTESLAQTTGAVFTIIYFLRTLQMGPKSWCATGKSL